MPQSFFALTPDKPPDDDNPLYDLTKQEFDMFYAEAEPLHNALVAALDAYSDAHPDLTMMACYIAADMLRYCLKRELNEDVADA